MSDALLIAALAIAFAIVIIVRTIRRRRFRAAAEPVGAAASVLRDVYSGGGTEARHAAEFDAAPTTSVELEGDDPLRVHGVWGGAGLDTVAERPTRPAEEVAERPTRPAEGAERPTRPAEVAERPGRPTE